MQSITKFAVKDHNPFDYDKPPPKKKLVPAKKKKLNTSITINQGPALPTIPQRSHPKIVYNKRHAGRKPKVNREPVSSYRKKNPQVKRVYSVATLTKEEKKLVQVFAWNKGFIRKVCTD